MAAIDPAGPLDLALLLTSGGIRVAGWARNGAASDVLAVMASTLLASVETMVETLGASRPAFVALEAPPYRALAMRLDSRHVLFLAAPETMKPPDLAREGRRIAQKLLAHGEDASMELTSSLRRR